MALYDIPNRRWIGISQQASNKKVSIGKRYMHTITTVVSSKVDIKVNFKTKICIDFGINGNAYIINSNQIKISK